MRSHQTLDLHPPHCSTLDRSDEVVDADSVLVSGIKASPGSVAISTARKMVLYAKVTSLRHKKKYSSIVSHDILRPEAHRARTQTSEPSRHTASSSSNPTVRASSDERGKSWLVANTDLLVLSLRTMFRPQGSIFARFVPWRRRRPIGPNPRVTSRGRPRGTIHRRRCERYRGI